MIMSRKVVTLLDYGAGNVRSVINALGKLGCDIRLVSCAEDILSAEILVCPGVGDFGSMMAALHQKRYTEPLITYLL